MEGWSAFRRFCVFSFLLLLTASPLSATVPTGFTETQVVTGLASPTAMEFAPDGRLFVCEQGGALRVIKNGALLTSPFLTVTVNSAGERGLLGITFDPGFATNHFLYIYYTATTPTIHNRISRFTANGDVAVGGSELIILELNDLSGATNHNGGAIHFGLDGKLYAAVGENANGANSQTLTNLLGKMLRINSDGTIPTDNPFYNTASGVNRAIWAMGLRNPFTFAFNPGNARMFINDVGQNTWEEINDGIAGSNYGWPNAEGNVGCGSYRCPLYTYDHSNGCAITGGIFYNPPTIQFPMTYLNDYFFADYCGGWIHQFDPSDSSVSDFASGLSSPVDLKVSSDGSLYYLVRGSGGSVYKIQYTASQAPSITNQPVNQTVSVGQPASFSVTASGTAPLNYQWQRNQVNIAGATSATYTIPSAQPADNGAKFRCVVTNAFGSATSNEATLTVTTNTPPTGTITQPPAGTLYTAGQTINYAGTGTDAEDGTLTGASFTWQVDFQHNTHAHPFIPPTTGSTSGSFTIPTTGETSDNVWYRIYLTVKDSGGLTQTTYRDILPRKSTVTLATNPSALQLKLDGQPVTSPFSFVGVVGIIRTLEAVSPQISGSTTYEFISWSDGKGIQHNISTPPTNTTYTATFQPLITPTGNGLTGTYFDNIDLTAPQLTRIDPTINFDWGKGSPAPNIAPDTFSIRWTGHIQPQYSETYTFYANTDDGVRLWVNGQQIINRWVQSSGETFGTITLAAGQKYTIQMEYFENHNRAFAKLSWSSPSQPKQIIPKLRLYSN